jgi:hypothetical protein
MLEDAAMLRKTILGRFSAAFIAVALMLFLPAGSLQYWQAWVYLGVIIVPLAFVLQYFLRRDPRFLEKLTDVVGLYLNPPEKALVLCVDEKSQIQALDRTQPGLPLKKGRCGTMTHDYKRNGTTRFLRPSNWFKGKLLDSALPDIVIRSFCCK